MTPHATDPADPPFWDQVRALFGDLLDRPADQREAALRDSPAPAAVKAEAKTATATTTTAEAAKPAVHAKKHAKKHAAKPAAADAVKADAPAKNS